MRTFIMTVLSLTALGAQAQVREYTEEEIKQLDVPVATLDQDDVKTITLPTPPVPPEPPVPQEVDTTKIFVVAEQMPQFKGNINKWLAQNLTYPVSAAENKIQGRVLVRFVVERDGSITNAEIVRSVDPELDREAINVVMRMPKWDPGINCGQQVRVSFVLPVTFKLQVETPKQ